MRIAYKSHCKSWLIFLLLIFRVVVVAAKRWWDYLSWPLFKVQFNCFVIRGHSRATQVHIVGSESSDVFNPSC